MTRAVTTTSTTTSTVTESKKRKAGEVDANMDELGNPEKKKSPPTKDRLISAIARTRSRASHGINPRLPPMPLEVIAGLQYELTAGAINVANRIVRREYMKTAKGTLPKPGTMLSESLYTIGIPPTIISDYNEKVRRYAKQENVDNDDEDAEAAPKRRSRAKRTQPMD